MSSKPSETAKAPEASPAPPAGAGDKEKHDSGDKPAGGGLAAFIPLIAAIVIAPALSWAVGQFVLMPQLKKQIAAAPVGAHAGENVPAAEEAPVAEAKGGKEGKEGKGEKGKEGVSPATYQFDGIVVNLAGTMGTRYLKTSFLVAGPDKNLHAVFEANKPKMVDITLNVLSSLSLSDLEEAGAKNIIREKLISSYNQALEKRVVEQIYFSDFVVQ